MALYELTAKQKQNNTIDRIIACGRLVTKSRTNIVFKWGRATARLYPLGLNGMVRAPEISVKKKLRISEVTDHWARDHRRSADCGASARICKLTNGEYAVIDVDTDDEGDNIFGNNDCKIKNIVYPLYKDEHQAIEAMYNYCHQD
jgi:hypothetical protein